MVYNTITSSKLHAPATHGCFQINFISLDTLLSVILVHCSVHTLQAERWDDFAY